MKDLIEQQTNVDDSCSAVSILCCWSSLSIVMFTDHLGE